MAEHGESLAKVIVSVPGQPSYNFTTMDQISRLPFQDFDSPSRHHNEEPSQSTLPEENIKSSLDASAHDQIDSSLGFEVADQSTVSSEDQSEMSPESGHGSSSAPPSVAQLYDITYSIDCLQHINRYLIHALKLSHK